LQPELQPDGRRIGGRPTDLQASQRTPVCWVADLFAAAGLRKHVLHPIPVLAIERMQGLDDMDDAEKWGEIRLIAPDLEDTTRYLLVLELADDGR
jgi:hypothetical protein